MLDMSGLQTDVTLTRGQKMIAIYKLFIEFINQSIYILTNMPNTATIYAGIN